MILFFFPPFSFHILSLFQSLSLSPFLLFIYFKSGSQLRVFFLSAFSALIPCALEKCLPAAEA